MNNGSNEDATVFPPHQIYLQPSSAFVTSKIPAQCYDVYTEEVAIIGWRVHSTDKNPEPIVPTSGACSNWVVANLPNDKVAWLGIGDLDEVIEWKLREAKDEWALDHETLAPGEEEEEIDPMVEEWRASR